MPDQTIIHPTTPEQSRPADSADSVGSAEGRVDRATVVSSVLTPRDSERRRSVVIAVSATVVLAIAAIVVAAGQFRSPPASDVVEELHGGGATPQDSDVVAGDQLDAAVSPTPVPVAPPASVEPVEAVRLVDDSVATDTGSVLIDVAANDRIDASLRADRAVTRIVDADPNGAVTIEGSAVRYRADPTFTGVDDFEYEVCHGTRCERATVTVDVTAAPRSTRFVHQPQRLSPTADEDGPSFVEPGETIAVNVHGQGSGADPTASFIRLTVTEPVQAGTITIGGRDPSAAPITSAAVEATDRKLTRIMRVRVDAEGWFVVGVGSGGNVTIDQIGVFVPTARSSDGRFADVAAEPIGVLDTSVGGRVLRIDASDHPEIPDTGVGFAVVRVEADVGADGGQIMVGAESYADADQRMTWAGSGESRTAVDELVVQLGDDGTFEVEYLGGTDITVSALGYFTDDSAPVSSVGLFVPVGHYHVA